MYDWLNERLLIASEETYRDLSNIQGKVMKHRTFEAEIQANKERLDTICEVSVKLKRTNLFSLTYSATGKYSSVGII